MNFLNRFENFLINELNIHTSQKIIVAVSGGVDSMVLLNMLMQTKHQIAVAHCNFCLRGEESNGDNELIKLFCNENNIQFFDKIFDTNSFTKENKIGIQEAARIIRYEWFNELLANYHFNFIATAHHLNDVTETLLFNITRGTGISGLHGIPIRNNNIIRPLLFATKDEIIEYAKENNISFRDDSSNNKNKYSRNKIRNLVVPVLKEINPLLEEHVHSLTNQITFIEKIYRSHIEEIWNSIHIKKNDTIEVPISELIQLHQLPYYLFEFLNPFGFNFSQTTEIISSLNEQSGKRFFSSTHLLLKDRKSIFITPVLNKTSNEICIEKGEDLITFNDAILKIEYLNIDTEINYTSNVFYFDLDSIVFPIKIRSWNNADKFVPLGMNNYKKVSDFFIDEKLSLIEKNEAIICCSNDGNIISILPYRIDNRNKITSDSKNILKITFVGA